MSGKGSSPRPYSVDKETFDQRFERIFGQARKPVKTQEEFTEWLIASTKEEKEKKDETMER